MLYYVLFCYCVTRNVFNSLTLLVATLYHWTLFGPLLSCYLQCGRCTAWHCGDFNKTLV